MRDSCSDREGTIMGFEYRGILPAMQLPFDTSLAIDEPDLRRLTRWLAGHEGIGGPVTNRHTREGFSLTSQWRAPGDPILADHVHGRLAPLSGHCFPGS